MIETNPIAWLGLIAIIMLSSLSGLLISRALPWSQVARKAGIFSPVGIAFAPFITGLATILALACLPGAPHDIHVLAVVAMVSLPAILILLFKLPLLPSPANETTRLGEWILGFLICLSGLIMLTNSIFLPLFQNDPLEYNLAARILFEARNLSAYPAIHPASSISGFFGPWTHPPLYVSLIYLTDSLQQHANAPGLMRLISPWFGLCAAGVVYSLGKLAHSRLVGQIAALIFLSTPILFLGCDSSMIDSLPTLGLALTVALVIGIETSAIKKGAVIGLALGASLWTHSQAILFFPLSIAAIAAFEGIRNWRTVTKISITAIAVSLLVAVWPYIRNYALFGSPISDNPAVFAMPALDWANYFKYARGLSNTTAIIQYGVLKGWFSFEFYALSFWLMTLGFLFILNDLRLKGIAQAISGGKENTPMPFLPLYVAGAIVLVYHAGVIASIMLGLDLMIRNERYMLVIQPYVAAIGSYGVYRLIMSGTRLLTDANTSALKRDIILVCFCGIFVMVLLQLFGLGVYVRWHEMPSKAEATNFATSEDKTRFERILDFVPSTHAVRWLNTHTREDDVVLSLHPAMMYYAQRKMISYLDPRMLPVYEEKSPENAVLLLRKLGVSYIQVPEYSLPVSYNSVLNEILASPKLTKLVMQSGMIQIYKLETDKKSVHEIADFTPGKMPWSRWEKPNLGGQELEKLLGVSIEPKTDNKPSVVSAPVEFGQRDFSTIMANGLGEDIHEPRADTLLPLEQGIEHILSFQLRGKGFVRLWFIPIDAEGAFVPFPHARVATARMSELVLSDDTKLQRISRRFIAPANARYLRVSIEQMGYSSVQIDKATLGIIK